jgi:hypothetical protein
MLSIKFPSDFFNELSAVYLALDISSSLRILSSSLLWRAKFLPHDQDWQLRVGALSAIAERSRDSVDLESLIINTFPGREATLGLHFACQLDLNMSTSGDLIVTSIDTLVHSSIVSDNFDSLETGKNGHNSRKKQQAIKNKTETLTHFYQRIQDYANRTNPYAGRSQTPLMHFLTTEGIPVHDERNTKVLTSSRFTQAC